MSSSGALLTLDQLMKLGIGQLPAGLVSAAVLRGLDRLSLPLTACFSYGCFEVRLAREPRVDVLVCAHRADGGARALARARLDAAGPAADVLRWWLRSRAARHVEAVWLEFDRPSAAGAAPPPFAFARFEGRHGARVAGTTARALGCAPSAAKTLARLLRELEAGEALLHLATLPHRFDDGRLRVHVGLPPERVPRFLAAAGWRGELALVTDLLAAWPQRRPLGVHLEALEGLSPSVGLELFLPTRPELDSRWAAVLKRAAAHGAVLDPERLALASQWPNAPAEPAPREHWPLRVERRMQVKLRLAPSAPLEAKAYLGFSPRFIPGALT